ncbi:MAG: hypothetical protein RBR42_04735 [Desulfomicrobium sp.]|jgi:hypothetical protein|nr:hypothetical protein [Desulfomicrobium sp.]NLV96981.1 hypothetical protein [Desulfovibrionales bacterium]
MNLITLYISTDEKKNEQWTMAATLTFQSMDSQWMLEGRIPEEKDIVPWQEVQLPSGELLSMGVVFDDPHKSIALHVKSQQGPILELMTKGHPCLRFVSPKGTDVTIQIHEDE